MYRISVLTTASSEYQQLGRGHVGTVLNEGTMSLVLVASLET